MPEPLHPLTWSLWRETILPFLTERFFGVPRRSAIFGEVASLDRIQGRVYFNLNAALAVPVLGTLLRTTLHHVDYRAGAVVDDLLARGILTPRRLRGAGRAPELQSVWSMVRSSPGTLRALRPKACLAELEAAAAAVARRPGVETLDAPALLAELRLWESTDAGALRDGMQMLTVALLIWIAADRLFAPFPDAQRLLVAGIRGNPTTEISVRLDPLIETARPLAPIFARALTTAELFAALATSDDGRDWLDRFRGFLAFCGQRGPREFDFAAPRWSDDPTMVLDLVRLALMEPDREAVGARLDRLGAEREAAIDAAVRSAPAWKRPLLRRAARVVAAILPLREAPKHYGLHVFQRMRQAAIELGRRLARAGVLADADDVFFLELAELEPLVLDTIGPTIGATMEAPRLSPPAPPPSPRPSSSAANSSPSSMRAPRPTSCAPTVFRSRATPRARRRGAMASSMAPASRVAQRPAPRGCSIVPTRARSRLATCWWSPSPIRDGRRSFRALRLW